MFSEVEHTRISISKATDPKKKSELGQFLTPAPIAQFMAKLFVRGTYDDCRLLDAGAGIGSLCAAFLDRWVSNGFNFQSVVVDAFEIDQTLQLYLTRTLAQYKTYPRLSATIRTIDFVYAATDHLSGNLFAEILPKYTHAILNPPYKKIHSNSAYRSVLRQAGIEAVNLYSAFVTLSLSLLENHGQLVAIIPRSFCNGPYYRPFRNFILGQTAIKHIHLFASRDKAFKDDKVLQENLIILLERGGQQGTVLISTSTDGSFADLTTQEYPFNRIVLPNDPEQFIHVPTSYVINTLESCPAVRYSLSDLGVEVSTGPVVDFRVKEYLRAKLDADTVPLLYPGHFNRNGNKRSKHTPKKPVAIQRNSETEKWLYPNGFYCVVRRFSAKEEPRRVIAHVVDPGEFADSPALGFENHLNVFHNSKQGLPKALAYGIAVFLNTTAVDEHFRTFNGHTQINATDLRRIKYPGRDTLIALGEWALTQPKLTQELIDARLAAVVT